MIPFLLYETKEWMTAKANQRFMHQVTDEMRSESYQELTKLAIIVNSEDSIVVMNQSFMTEGQKKIKRL